MGITGIRWYTYKVLLTLQIGFMPTGIGLLGVRGMGFLGWSVSKLLVQTYGPSLKDPRRKRMMSCRLIKTRVGL